MAEPAQPSTEPKTENQPAPAKPATVDLTKLDGDDLNKVLENPNLFKLPRIAEALEAQKQLKKLETQQQSDKEKSLAEQKKFEELAEERGNKITTLEKQIQNNSVSQALTGLLVKENVVDLDGALKLVDRSKISVDEDGTVSGAEDALNALKTDKAYLFSGTSTSKVGSASNTTNSTQAPSGQYKFKESQLTPEFYQAHKAEIDLAGKQGLIEPDGPPSQI